MILKLFFFHIYNTYYKNGRFKNDTPHLTAFCIVSAAVSMLLASAVLAIGKLGLGAIFSKIQVMIFFCVPLPFLWYYLLFGKKYKTIYAEVRKSKYDKSLFKILSWSVIVIAFGSIVLFSYIFNR